LQLLKGTCCTVEGNVKIQLVVFVFALYLCSPHDNREQTTSIINDYEASKRVENDGNDFHIVPH